jgi:uncharacterized membrane protein YgcG
MSNDIERELEEALHRVLDPISARPIPMRRAVHSRSAFRTVTGGAGAALTVKLLTGVAAAAAAVTVAGAVTTGSLNPVNWGEAVTTRVQACKDDIATNGQHGIGDCVSQLASTHGATVSNAARHHGNPNGTNNGSNGGNNGNGGNGGNGSSTGNNGANGHGNGKSQSHPTPPPKSRR